MANVTADELVRANCSRAYNVAFQRCQCAIEKRQSGLTLTPVALCEPRSTLRRGAHQRNDVLMRAAENVGRESGDELPSHAFGCGAL